MNFLLNEGSNIVKTVKKHVLWSHSAHLLANKLLTLFASFFAFVKW